jgi:iron(III) transport system ATP-binding protein
LEIVAVRGLSKKYGDTVAVEDASFSVEKGGFTAMVGPSGSGKTTVLRCLAGVEKPDAGDIEIGGRLVYSARTPVNVPPEARNIGMVYQTLALWPHMSVFDNIAYPLRTRGMKANLEDKVTKLTSMLKIDAMHARLPSELSGGEQQRVALARALVYDPALLLLDEPFGNLDAPLRDELGDELKLVQRATGTSMIYVTHDRLEALSMSGNLILMNRARVVAVGPPLKLLENPPDSYTASFLSGMLVLDAEVVGSASGQRTANTEVGELTLPPGVQMTGRVKIAVPAEAISLLPNNSGAKATVRGIAYPRKGEAHLRLEIAGQVINMPISDPSLHPSPGEIVTVKFDESAIRVLPS